MQTFWMNRYSYRHDPAAPGVVQGPAQPATSVQFRDTQQSLQQLREAMQHLPDEDREVFLLRQNGGLSYEEIAQLRKSPVGVIKGQMRKVLRTLQTALQPQPAC
jgi:RNA polymerase sigma-70 factor (ECF subfamily)